MYSVVVDGEVLDFRYKKINKYTYTFHVGNIYIGQIFKMTRDWTAVSSKPTKLHPIHGFRTRYHASEFLLKLRGYA